MLNIASIGRHLKHRKRVYRSLLYSHRVARRAGTQLREILEQNQENKGVVLILCGITWHSTRFQRPHQLARAFARMGYLVFYVSLNWKDRAEVYTRVDDRLYVTPFDRNLATIANPIIVSLSYSKWALQIFKRPYRLIYDFLDNLELFKSVPRRTIEEYHDWYLKHADVINATSDNLLDQVQKYRPDAILGPNAVDYPFFQHQTQPDPPADLVPLLNKPIIGFYGSVEYWSFDNELFCDVARRCPDMHFVILGECACKEMPGTWAQIPNVHYLGPKQYQELPAYAAHFSVATVPFCINEISVCASPVKLFEYFAAGLPVVSTALPECKKYASVYIANDAEDFAKGLRYILAGKYDPAVIDTEAQANDWIRRVEAMIDALNARELNQGIN